MPFVIKNQSPDNKYPCFLLPLGTRSFTYDIIDAQRFVTRREALRRLRLLRDLNFDRADKRRENYQVAIAPLGELKG